MRERGCCQTTQLDAILSAEAMTTPGVPGSKRTDAPCCEEQCAVTALLALTSAILTLGAQDSRPASSRSASTAACSRRQDLGLLEGPDRDAWQRPEQIMDELGIGEGKRRR